MSQEVLNQNYLIPGVEFIVPFYYMIIILKASILCT